MSVKKYRKKPVTIEAMQWNGTSQGATPIIQWILDNGGSGCLWCSDPDRCSKTGGDCPHTICIRTLEGDMHASLGDYIIRGVQGEFYPCRADVFAATYEEVINEELQSP